MNTKFFTILTLILTTGCSIRVKSDPVQVNHTIDLADIEDYFEKYCESMYPDATEEEIHDCVVDEVADFLASIEKATDFGQ